MKPTTQPGMLVSRRPTWPGQCERNSQKSNNFNDRRQLYNMQEWRPTSDMRHRDASNLKKKAKMRIGLRSEFHRFSQNGVLLKRLYSDTLKALDDIYFSGVIPKEAWKNLDGKVKEIHKLRSTIGRPPSVIILGQNCRSKAILVNELLGQTQLPVEESTEALSWRMVRFKYSRGKSQVLLTLGSSYELVENLQENHWKSRHIGIRNIDLAVPEKEATGPLEDNPVVEVHLEHPLLQSSVQMVVPPTGNLKNLREVLQELFETTTPIVLYGVAGDSLSEEDVLHLQMIKGLSQKLPIFFIRMPTSEEISGLTEVDRNEVLNHGGFLFTPEGGTCGHVSVDPSGGTSDNIPSQLESLGFLSQGVEGSTTVIEETTVNGNNPPRKEVVTSRFIRCLNDLYALVQFVRSYLQSQLISASDFLHDIQNYCLQLFILSAFDMAREMQVTPKRIEYSRLKEAELFDSLLRIAEKKQDEMCNLIAETINERKEDILQKAERHQFDDPFVRNWEGPLSGKLVSQCMDEIRELVVLDLNNILAQKLITSVYCLHDTFLGTLERCISSLERNLNDIEDDSALASVALKQILTAAYQINISSDRSSSLLKGLIDKVKRILESLPWYTVDSVDASWRRTIANDILKVNLVCQKQLAQTLCGQLREKLKASHESFIVALRHLETHHNERLEKTGEQGFRLRKIHAPRLARLSLETSSIIDFLRFGMPSYGKEVGRGQYGVVYACEYWGPFRPCAVKSVVPMDDKHWNDLAMEFYFMKSIPENERVVRVRGSVIDHSYAGGIPAVLIIMDKLSRDLYCAIKVGLPWLTRLQVHYKNKLNNKIFYHDVY
ncbi:unnamed protein product [Orchesella dallaii]|uniref:Dual serine/threonine and tyrosine protein kinase n=1 Tax=Orchesella dallaii TaxID=48710 RepID=A0ABP1R3K3_9HEXA